MNNRVVDLGNLFSELSRFMKGTQSMFFKFFSVFLNNSTSSCFHWSHQLPHSWVCISWRCGQSEHPLHCLFHQIWRFFKVFYFFLQSVTVLNCKLLIFHNSEHTFLWVSNELLLYGPSQKSIHRVSQVFEVSWIHELVWGSKLVRMEIDFLHPTPIRLLISFFLSFKSGQSFFVKLALVFIIVFASILNFR